MILSGLKRRSPNKTNRLRTGTRIAILALMNANATVYVKTQFEYKDIPKGAGGRWDPKQKAWTMTLAQWLDLADTIDYGSFTYNRQTAKFYQSVMLSLDGVSFVSPHDYYQFKGAV